MRKKLLSECDTSHLNEDAPPCNNDANLQNVLNGDFSAKKNELLKVFHCQKLCGKIEVDASKNAFLPILAGCVLCDGEICFDNFVHLSDLENMLKILGEMNILFHLSGRELLLDTRSLKNNTISHELAGNLRASIILLGAMLGRFRSCVIAYPGGCKIGTRPIDIHIGALKSLGVKIVERHGYIHAFGQNLHAGEVVFPFPSVGATENLMLCCCLLNGESVLKNVAKEPEIVDLQNFLNCMGAKVSGAGTDQIRVVGVKNLHGGSYHIMSDRIVAGTYLLATATIGGDVMLENAVAQHNESLISFLRQSACQIETCGCKIRIRAQGRLPSVGKIETMPYPYFPTDLQPQMMLLQAVSNGVCMMHENVFENRFAVVQELRKMGANIVVRDRVACVLGVEKLLGADVFACDLRAGAALVVAGLKAEGYTTVHNISYIDRGYENIEQKFESLGANIKRVLQK